MCEGCSTSHSHSLEYSDAHKRNSFIRGLVQSEIAKGYTPGAVIDSLRPRNDTSSRAELDALGGRYVTKKDAANWTKGKETNVNTDSQVEENELRGIELALATQEAIDKIKARFDEVLKYANSLPDKNAHDRVLAKWNNQMQNLSKALLEQN